MALERRKPHGTRYPWESWFKRGKATTLRKGRDYAGTTYGMVSTVKQAAKRYGYEVELTIDEQEGRITLKRIA